jgi:hypothetical protein
VYVIKLLPLMIFNEGLQCFLSNRWFVQLLRLGSFKCSSDFCHFVVNVGAPLWMSRRNLYRFFWYSVKISYDKRMSCKSASSWLCGFSSLMFQWRSMLSFYVFPYAVSHTFECHSAFLTFSSHRLSQMLSGEYDSCRVIRLTMLLHFWFAIGFSTFSISEFIPWKCTMLLEIIATTHRTALARNILQWISCKSHRFRIENRYSRNKKWRLR